MDFKVAGEVHIGSRVNFHDEHDHISQEIVTEIWPLMGGQGGPPGVNLGNRYTSVPHKSHVPTATGLYWTLADI